MSLASARVIGTSSAVSLVNINLINAKLTPIQGAGYTVCNLYDGLNNGGSLIAVLKSSANMTDDFAPSMPIACTRGLYAEILGGVETQLTIVYI
jgi:hypothetical protein